MTHAHLPVTPDPRLARVLLRYRESVARAAERAYRDLDHLGYLDIDGDPLRDLIPQTPTGTRQSDTPE